MEHWSRIVDRWNKEADFSWSGLQLAVQMSILQELKKLNTLLHCRNFQRIPAKLDRIGRNTTKAKRKK